MWPTSQLAMHFTRDTHGYEWMRSIIAFRLAFTTKLKLLNNKVAEHFTYRFFSMLAHRLGQVTVSNEHIKITPPPIKPLASALLYTN